MSVLILAPILAIFLVFINVVVIVLYSHKFLPINEMILWAALGIYFKAASWALGVLFISRGDVKTLFWIELVSNVMMLGLNLLGYYYYGLEGLGISFFVSYIFTFLLNFFIVKYKFGFSYSTQFYKIFTIQLALGIIGFLIAKLINKPVNYFLGIGIILISSWYSIILLDKRIGLRDVVKNAFSNQSKG